MELVRSQHLNLTTVILLLLGIPLLFWPTSLSMITMWEESETFTHGFLIFPISIWLIWQRRPQLSRLTAQPNYLALPLIILAGLGWLVAYSVDVQVVQQFALIALIQLSILLVLGTVITKQILFPLLYLYFAVPFGENLIPPLMEITATFTVNMVELTGIPIYRDGLFFSLPTGDWSVVQACSGIRYLIASFALGSLYAYLTYTSNLKRSVFIVVSLIVPIFANGMRAFMIVMIGHYSGMELAVGADHLLYGWFFFGIVIFIMFYIGSFWRDPLPEENVDNADVAPRTEQPLKFILKPLLIVIGGLGLLVLTTLGADSQRDSENSKVVIQAPEIENWQLTNSQSIEWRPVIYGATSTLATEYQQKNQPSVLLYIAYFNQQTQGSEAASSMNRMAPLQPDKEKIEAKLITSSNVSVDGNQLIESVVSLNSQQYLINHWYQIGPFTASNRYIAKVYEALSKIIYSRRDAALIAIATPREESHSQSQMRLEHFYNNEIKSLSAKITEQLSQP